jgi:hypothetical protein
MSVAWESLRRAVHELASSAPLKQRLIFSYSKHLKELDSGELPSDLRAMFLELSGQLTSVTPLRGESAVSATVRKMSNGEAEEAAQQIVRLFGELSQQKADPISIRPRRTLSLYAAEG